MYKKLLILCLNLSFICQGTSTEPQKDSLWQRCLRVASMVKENLHLFIGVGASTGGALHFMEKMENAYLKYDSKMYHGNMLNQWWVSFLKKNPNLDLTPSLQSNINQLLASVSEKELGRDKMRSLESYLLWISNNTKELPGDYDIKRAIENDFAAYKKYQFLACFFVGTLVALFIYALCMDLDKKSTDKLDNQEKEVC